MHHLSYSRLASSPTPLPSATLLLHEAFPTALAFPIPPFQNYLGHSDQNTLGLWLMPVFALHSLVFLTGPLSSLSSWPVSRVVSVLGWAHSTPASWPSVWPAAQPVTRLTWFLPGAPGKMPSKYRTPRLYEASGFPISSAFNQYLAALA